jgi:hypothetical protein
MAAKLFNVDGEELGPLLSFRAPRGSDSGRRFEAFPALEARRALEGLQVSEEEPFYAMIEGAFGERINVEITDIEIGRGIAVRGRIRSSTDHEQEGT